MPDCEMQREFGLSQCLRLVQGAYLDHLVGCKPRPSVACASRVIASPFLFLVEIVGTVVTQPQMARVATRRVVVAMQHEHPRRDLTVSECPCESMRQPQSAMATRSSVAIGHAGTLPWPASRRSTRQVNSSPKMRVRLKQHRSTFRFGVLPPDVGALRGLRVLTLYRARGHFPR